MSDELWTKIADLWFNQNYSPIDIGQELALPMDDVERTIRLMGKLEAIIKRGLLDEIRAVLEL